MKKRAMVAFKFKNTGLVSRFLWVGLPMAICILIGVYVLLSAETQQKINDAENEDMSSLFGCNISLRFQYNDVVYRYVDNTTKTIISEDWAPTAIIETATTDEGDSVSLNLQANHREVIGCTIWTSDSDPDWLYLQTGDQFTLFVPKHLKYSWIFYNEALYLNAGQGDTSAAEYMNHSDSSCLPDGFVFLGNADFEEGYRLPTIPLFSNAGDIRGHKIYYNPKQENVLFVAIPRGIAGKDGYKTRYDNYIKTDPAIFSQ